MDVINRPFDPECRQCGGTGYVDFYTSHLDHSVAQRCNCDTLNSDMWSGDGWMYGALTVPARFYGALLVPADVRRVVLHCGNSDRETFAAYFQNPIERDPDGQRRWRVVSAHFAVLDNGIAQQMVPVNRVAWHAQGNNTQSIGIEMRGPYTRDDWPDIVVERVVEIVRAMCLMYPIEQVCSHRSLAPYRRNDPGRNFPWVALGDRLLGLVITP